MNALDVYLFLWLLVSRVRGKKDKENYKRNNGICLCLGYTERETGMWMMRLMLQEGRTKYRVKKGLKEETGQNKSKEKYKGEKRTGKRGQ